MEADRYYLKMTTTPVSKLIIRMGIPTTVSMLITNVYNLVDTYFIGQLGKSQQAAAGVLFTLQTIIQGLAFMLGHGSGTYVCRALADKDVDTATTYVSTAFYTAILVGFFLMALGFPFLTPFVKLLGSTPTILPYARIYGSWVLASAPFMIASLVLNNNLRYEGKAFFAMIGLSTGGVLNIFGDWLLVSVCDMGINGAGLATAVSQVVSFVILLVMYKKHAQSCLRLCSVSRKPQLYFQIIRVGFPSLLRQGLASISNGVLNNLARPFGDAAIAAMSVVNRFSAFVLCIGLGIGQGYQPVCSFNYQAKRYDRVKRGLVFTTVFGEMCIGVLVILGLVFAEPIVRLFQKEEAVILIGTPALRYAVIGLIALPFSIPVSMLYQSIQQAGMATLMAFMRSGALLIPALFLCTHFLGLTGIQIAQPLADVLAGIISVPFILHFLKKTPGSLFPDKEKNFSKV